MSCLVVPEAQKTVHKQDKPQAPEDGAHASAEAVPCLPTAQPAQAHPPAAGGQPLPAFVQHQAFFATLQPAIQFAKPASQSYGADVVTTVAHPPPWAWQPLP